METEGLPIIIIMKSKIIIRLHCIRCRPGPKKNFLQWTIGSPRMNRSDTTTIHQIIIVSWHVLIFLLFVKKIHSVSVCKLVKVRRNCNSKRKQLVPLLRIYIYYIYIYIYNNSVAYNRSVLVRGTTSRVYIHPLPTIHTTQPTT
jgi:hypothetical protein